MKYFLLRVRRIFIAGLLISLPLVVTIVVFKFAFETLDNFLGPIVTELLIKLGVPIAKKYQLPGLGVIATLALVFLIGLFTTNFIGRRLIKLGEWIVEQIPVIRSVYTGAKQVIETFSSSGSKSFSKVVMLEYPRKGIWCLAFITAEASGETQARTAKKLISIFLPTTPNPTSGFLLLVPEEDLIELDMNVEEGIKLIVSAGLVTPETLAAEKAAKQKLPAAPPEPAVVLKDETSQAEPDQP